MKARLEGQWGLMGDVRMRLAEGWKVVEMAGRRAEERKDGDAVGGMKRVDGRVMEAIEEA